MCGCHNETMQNYVWSVWTLALLFEKTSGQKSNDYGSKGYLFSLQCYLQFTMMTSLLKGLEDLSSIFYQSFKLNIILGYVTCSDSLNCSIVVSAICGRSEWDFKPRGRFGHPPKSVTSTISELILKAVALCRHLGWRTGRLTCKQQ